MVVMHIESANSGWSDRRQPFVLVVDDDPVARFLYRQALEQEGFQVADASDGGPALAMFQEREPDLVLLDVLMPGMDGFATCAALRRLPMGIGAHVPVLMVTGLDDVGSIRAAYDAGATDFVTKPINWTILIQRLRYMLRANESLRRLGESERRLAQAQRIAALGSWDWDIRSGEMTWSREMFRLLGYEAADDGPPEVRPSLSAVMDRVHPDDRAHFGASIDRILAAGALVEKRIDVRIAGIGEQDLDDARIIRFTGRMMLDRRGSVVRAVGVAQDITERRRGEDTLRKALQQAEAANRAKSDFLANMSHELRTPMNAILGFTEIMDMKLYGPLGNDHYQDYVRLIHESGEHLLQLINAILDLSKAEQGMIELREDRIDVCGTVRACRRLLQTQADAKHIVLALDLPDQPPILWADEFRVRQILLNILSNALKFTPDGGKVTLRIRCDSSGGDSAGEQSGGLVFEVADTGIGMRVEDIPIALAKFGQIDSSLSRRYDGTGLGLPLTKRLTELHGGSLRIQSLLGVGTTVTVTFPRSRLLADRRRMATEGETVFPNIRPLLKQTASS
ncbi:response regulator [Skermanella mucosa]|uniref:ATP-binding response regulator n=1 Tax=Skermanella mucosa TaxID=1789672 RepID=UPI001E2B32B5|nr:response regulator [Skermanella mucosa]UEM23661.1 response regulator [Skermanella mucosa]